MDKKTSDANFNSYKKSSFVNLIVIAKSYKKIPISKTHLMIKIDPR